jgi:hypothetical protein
MTLVVGLREIVMRFGSFNFASGGAIVDFLGMHDDAARCDLNEDGTWKRFPTMATGGYPLFCVIGFSFNAAAYAHRT